MSAIMHERAVDGTTIGLRIVTDSGDEIDYSSGRGLTMAIENSPIFTEGQAEGAVVAMLSIDDFKDPGLKAASALRRLAEALEAAQVANARRQGWSWQDIAEVLAVSRQAVHQKHSPAEKGKGGRACIED